MIEKLERLNRWDFVFTIMCLFLIIYSLVLYGEFGVNGIVASFSIWFGVGFYEIALKRKEAQESK